MAKAESTVYPENLTGGPFMRAHPCGDKMPAVVVFDHFEPRLSRFFHVEVHWTLAFEYLRATNDNVVGVRFTDGFGGTSANVTFAKWVRDLRGQRAGLYRIVHGACIGAPCLDELREPKVRS